MAGLLDFLQSASNSVASNVTAPVDGIAWLLRKAGIPVPDAPVGGSDWAQNAGLTRPVQQSASSLAGESLGMIAPMLIAAKAPQVARGLLQGADNLMAPRTLNPETGAIVWQGSPHKFDKFDASKIGTGEGAQSYGHGMYVAGQKAVGQEYAKRLSKDGTGYLYKIDLPDEHIAKMLDWDKPLSQQPQAIQDAVKPLLKDVFDVRGYKGGWGSLEPDADAIRDVFTKTGHPLGTYSAKDVDALNFSGSAIVKALGNMDSESAATAQLLRKQGLTGIRYLDGGSRGTGAGTSNFVVFPGNEDLLSILERNGQALPKKFVYPQDKALATAQRNAALPIEQGGLGLGAENTAMERARALGFDTDFYHGQTGMSLSNKGEMVELTPNAGKAEGGALFGSGPNLASRYAKDRDWLGQGGAVYPLKARSDHLLKDGYPMPELADINKMSSKEVDSLVNDIDNWNNKIDKPSLFESGLHDANKANADGVVFRQVVDAPTWVDARREFPQDIYGLQKGARSRFAAFDPMRRNEADLLGRADPELLGLLSAGLLGYGGYNALSKP